MVSICLIAGDRGQEGLGDFVIVRSDTAKVFDLVDEAFDEIAFLESRWPGCGSRESRDDAARIGVRSGGKSPTYVDRSASSPVTVERIAPTLQCAEGRNGLGWAPTDPDALRWHLG